ncbi:MAG: hypothetical protein ACRD8O_07885, partial [Bryobacteraceae bacterium]
YGLQGKSANLQPAIGLAKRYWNETHSPLARAWLAVALRAHATEVAIQTPPVTDVTVTALEAIALTGVLA